MVESARWQKSDAFFVLWISRRNGSTETYTWVMRIVVPKPTIGARNLEWRFHAKTGGDTRRFWREWRVRSSRRRTPGIGKKEFSLATIFVIFPAKDAYASCARRVVPRRAVSRGGSWETRETREEHEIDQKSWEIEAGERRKRDEEKEVLEGGKKERKEETRIWEGGRQKKGSSCWQVYECMRRVCTHQHVDPYPRHMERARESRFL